MIVKYNIPADLIKLRKAWDSLEPGRNLEKLLQLIMFVFT